MNNSKIRILLLATLIVSSPLVVAQQAPLQPRVITTTMPEPARWTQEDVTTSQKYATAQKELAAAKFDALNACKTVMPAQHDSCVREANTIYAQDMAEVQKRLYPSR